MKLIGKGWILVGGLLMAGCNMTVNGDPVENKIDAAADGLENLADGVGDAAENLGNAVESQADAIGNHVDVNVKLGSGNEAADVKADGNRE